MMPVIFTFPLVLVLILLLAGCFWITHERKFVPLAAVCCGFGTPLLLLADLVLGGSLEECMLILLSELVILLLGSGRKTP